MKKLSLALVAVLVPLVVYAATKGDLPPKARNGAVQVLNSAATKVFTGVPGRNVFAIYNNGPNTEYCGFVSNVTTATGFPVPPGASLAVDLAYHDTGDQDVYCIAATADQVSPADSRWIQVK